MNKNWFAVGLVAAMLGLVAVPRVAPHLYVAGPAAPANTYGLEASLPKAFGTDKVAAQKLGGICDGMADLLVADAQRQPPKIVNCAQVNDSIRTALDMAYAGVPLKQSHPAVVEVLSPVFKQVMPDGTVKIDDAKRQEVIGLLRAIAYGCGRV